MLNKILYHLRKGDLISAAKYKLDLYKWKNFSRDKESFFIEPWKDIKLKLYTDSMFSRVIWHGGFEEGELTFMKNFIKEKDVVLDIGANIGLHALIAGKLSGPNGKVIAAEPVDYIYRRLKENIEINNTRNITLLKKAFSDKTGTAEITISLEGFDAWNSLGGQSNMTGSRFKKETIETTTLDDFLADANTPTPDFIKIDTEGWEYNVLKGSTILGRIAPVLMIEYSDEISSNFGFSTAMVFDKLTEYGYKLYDYDHKKNSLKLLKKGDKVPLYNAIAAKQENDISKRITDVKFI
jgi:FkbM family methyltransferase